MKPSVHTNEEKYWYEWTENSELLESESRKESYLVNDKREENFSKYMTTFILTFMTCVTLFIEFCQSTEKKLILTYLRHKWVKNIIVTVVEIDNHNCDWF